MRFWQRSREVARMYLLSTVAAEKRKLWTMGRFFPTVSVSGRAKVTSTPLCLSMTRSCGWPPFSLSWKFNDRHDGLEEHREEVAAFLRLGEFRDHRKAGSLIAGCPARLVKSCRRRGR